MTNNLTFRVEEKENKAAGDNVFKKTIVAKVKGEVVARIFTRINDLNQCYANPGYSVTVWAEDISGKVIFRDSYGTFENGSIAEARSNRGESVRDAKEKIKKTTQVIQG